MNPLIALFNYIYRRSIMSEQTEELKNELNEVALTQEKIAEQQQILADGLGGIASDITLVKALVTQLKDEIGGTNQTFRELEAAVSNLQSKSSQLLDTATAQAEAATAADTAGDEVLAETDAPAPGTE